MKDDTDTVSMEVTSASSEVDDLEILLCRECTRGRHAKTRE